MKNSQKEAAIVLNNMRVLLHEVCELYKTILIIHVHIITIGVWIN